MTGYAQRCGHFFQFHIMSNLAAFMIGAVIVAAAVGFGLHKIGVGTTWSVIAVAAIIGLALMTGVGKTRQKDSPTDHS